MNTSSLTQKGLDQIRTTFNIPKNLECRVPGPNSSVIDIRDDEIAFYPYLFKLGVRLPLHPFICEFLTFYGLSPVQLAPNGWIVLLGIIVISHLSGGWKWT